MSEALPLILVPGLACTAELFAAQTAAFASRDIVVADTSGQDTKGQDTSGQDTGGQDTGGPDTIAAIAAAILADAPPRFAVAGLSMGGYVCFELWRQAPQRIARFGLIDTQARPDTPAAADVRKRMIELGEEGQLDKIHEALWPRLIAPGRREDRALEIVVRRMLQQTGAEVFVRQQRAILGRIDSRPILPTITVPALVVVGADDQITPPDLAREMADAMPDAELVVVPGAGHLSPLENPDAVTAALVRWLAR